MVTRSAPLACVLGLAACAALGCSAGVADDDAASGQGGAGGEASSSPAGSGGGFTTGSGGGFGAGSGGGAPDGCDDAAKNYVYVLGSSRELYRFQPSTLQLSPIAVLNCPGDTIGSTFSMAVDRSGTAWVLYSDGQLYRVSTADGACTSTGYNAFTDGWFSGFGMGFVAEGPNTEAETLFLGTEQGLAKLDTQSLQSSLVGGYDTLPTTVAELTGTGDGRLFAYFSGSPVTFAEIDKTNAHVVSSAALQGIPQSSWAFAFWGGSFWLFNGPEIRKYDAQTQALQLVVPNVGFNIVGAGVSTCAPTIAPQ